MANLSTRNLREQDGHAAKGLGYPTGDVRYVDSVNGSNGNDGQTKEHAVLTLVYALTLSRAGDTIVLCPGGSETVTATLSVSLARLKIVCPAANPQSGYTITAAGTIDLVTVSAADVHIEGLQLVHTGTTSSAAGILTTAAADRLRVERCFFDDSAIVTNFTGFGVEVTDDCNGTQVVDCLFKDMHRGVIFVNTDTDMIGALVQGCEFWVGQSTAFGVHSDPAGTGTATGLRISGCTFIECDGDGTAATDAWDGTSGTDATSGPILLDAATDQWIIEKCLASTALSVTFENTLNVNAGAAGEIVESFTAQGGDVTDVYSDTTIIASDVALIYSDTTVIEAGFVAIASDTVVIESSVQVVESDLVIVASDCAAIDSNVDRVYSDTTIIASDLVIVTSDTTQIASDVVVVASDVLLVYSDTTIIASDLIIAASDAVVIESSVQVVESDLLICASDVLLVYSDTTIIASDLVVVDSWQPRVVKASAVALTGGSLADRFTIANGPILLLGLFMHVTETVDAACTGKWSLDPTIGASNTDLCGALELNAAAVGDVFYVEGASGDVMVKGANGTALALGMQDGHGQFLMPGGIDLTLLNSDPTTGIADVYLVYRPLAANAAVSAA